MLLRTCYFSASALALALSIPNLAAAQEDPDPYKGQKNLVEVGVYGGVLIPSKDHEFYDPPAITHQEITPPIDLGLRAAFFPFHFFGIEAEAGILPTAGRTTNQSALLWTVRGHLIAQYQARLTPFVLVGAGAMGVSSDTDALGDDADPTFHAGVGAKYALNHVFGVRVDGRVIGAPSRDDIGRATNTAHWELLAGLSATFGRPKPLPPDPDKDGVRGEADKCPTVAAQTKDGCPPPDSDGDGVADDKDECADVPGEAPLGCPPPDSDQDGIIDREDACKTVAGPKELGGCPDSDGDGILDKDDKCATEKGVPEQNGCPDPDPDKDNVMANVDQCPGETGVAPHGCPDQDGDGVPDKSDQCVDKPETKNGFQDADGCPDELPKAVQKFTGAIQGITFKAASAEVQKSSFGTLDRAAKVLAEFADLRLEVQGHTDNTGDHDANVKLSDDRAQAVRNYLVSKGIAAERIIAKGFGPDQPAADNKTAAGRAKNRRIEFKLLTE